jgi:hypothetical protein
MKASRNFPNSASLSRLHLRKPHLRQHHPKSPYIYLNKVTTTTYLQAKPPKMLTKYLTSVTTAFSPFNPKSGKTARNFLAMLPPNARSTMAIDVKLLPQAQKSLPATLALKFSTLSINPAPGLILNARNTCTDLRFVQQRTAKR